MHRGAETPLGLGQQVGTVGVHHHVLGSGQERHRQGRQGEQLGRRRRRQAGHQPQQPAQGQLGEHQPAPAPAQEGRLEAVHEGRPEELEGVGNAHQAEEADGGQVDAVHRQPGLHGLAGEGQGQAGGEAQHQDGGQAPGPAQTGAGGKDRGLGHAQSRPRRQMARLARKLGSSVTSLPSSKAFSSRMAMPFSSHRAWKSAMVKKRTLGESYHW